MMYARESDAAQLKEPLNPEPRSLANSLPDPTADMSKNFTSFSDQIPQEQGYVDKYVRTSGIGMTEMYGRLMLCVCV